VLRGSLAEPPSPIFGSTTSGQQKHESYLLTSISYLLSSISNPNS
jgi:hypothetical protein